MINVVLLFNSVFMMIIVILMTLVNHSWTEKNRDLHAYIFEEAEPTQVIAAKAFGSFFLLNNSFLPMDLAMGFELGRFMYIYFIEYDA
jgi:hypothetical protein